MDEPETEAIDLDYRPLTYFDSLVQPIQPVVFVVSEEDSAQDSEEYWASPWDDAVEIAQIHIRTIHWDIVADFYEDFDAVLREQVRTETAAVEARAAGKR